MRACSPSAERTIVWPCLQSTWNGTLTGCTSHLSSSYRKSSTTHLDKLGAGMLKTTPFHARTAPLVRAQTWRRWAGHQVASAYEPLPDREYAAVRSSAALFDVSPLHKYLIGGRDAERLLDRMVTRDVTKCQVGQVLY